jgi:tRNA(His) 5'-end guanylyltransferase
MDYKFFYKNLQAGKAYKYWEKQWDTAIVADNSFIMRLDGRAFSKYQNNFRRPHDEAFFRAMALTACDLLLEFKCNSCYCESDEISMIWFHPKKPQYQGRMQKLCSVIAGFASARFNDHVKRQVFRVICENNEELRSKLGICLDDLVVSDKTVIFGDDLITSNGVYEPDKLRHIIAGRAHFDARVFCMPEPDHVLKYVLSRMDDGLRNAVNAFARMRFSQEEMTNKSCKQVLRMLRRENMDLSKEPDWFKYGVLVKVARVGATSIFREYIPAGKRPSSSAMVNPLGRGSVPACFAVMMKNCDHWLQVLQAEVVETVEERFVVPWSQTSTLPVDQIDNDEENTEALAIENAIAEDGSRTPKSRYRLYDSDYEEDDPRTAALSSDEDEADEPVNQPPLETVLDPRMVEYARKTHEEGDTIALGLGSQE